jgi:hypothetical protein
VRHACLLADRRGDGFKGMESFWRNSLALDLSQSLGERQKLGVGKNFGLTQRFKESIRTSNDFA